ncbi:PiggyBac transposable element-derived protein 3 [Elysia marginata]|uniref:PiggyBac transposable element-derived protein 3 n=1 Tax=Elysia marginata TaxID=1093978 RepID=A0AAV4F8N9_9GAST|nr:PiggyBac transposable element-derived protein 3 [Elysia marginata]
MRPLFNMLNDKILLYWINEQKLNVEESMAAYNGRHGAKQFICGKPIRYGFKLWCLNTIHPMDTSCRQSLTKEREYDNSVVALGSTKHGISSLKNVQRFAQSERRHIQVPCPNAVIHFNKHTGGTDRMDQNTANKRVNIRIKKWWWPLFVLCLNTSTNNAWCLYRKSAAARQRSLDYLVS